MTYVRVTNRTDAHRRPIEPRSSRSRSIMPMLLIVLISSRSGYGARIHVFPPYEGGLGLSPVNPQVQI